MVRSRNKVLVLADWTDREHRDFVSAMPDTDLEVWRIRSAPERGRGLAGKLFQFWLPCLMLALKAFRLRKRYRAVICWQQVMGFFLAWLKLAMRSHEPFLIVSGMYFNPGSRGLPNRLRRAFIKKSLCGIEKVIVYSPGLSGTYAKVFGAGEDRFIFAPLPAFVIPEGSGGGRPGGGEYVFSGGISNRDFETLLRAARGVDYPVRIACDRRDYEKLKAYAPSNVSFHVNIPLGEFVDLIAGSKMVVILLESAAGANGQIVMLQAMALGRPVIMTRGAGAEPYLSEGVNGLLVEEKNVGDLEDKIRLLLGDGEICDSLGLAAARSVRENRSRYAFALGRVLQEAGQR